MKLRTLVGLGFSSFADRGVVGVEDGCAGGVGADGGGKGNVLVEGIVGVQKEAVLAARRAVVTVEEVVENLGGAHPNSCILPHWTIAALALVPGGAHPSYAHGYYDRDNAAYVEWDTISADRESFRAWMESNVMRAGPEHFAGRVAGLLSAR